MRIAMVSEHASPLAAVGGHDAGGQNVHVEALARGLAARGHEVTVYTRKDNPRLAPRIQMAPRVTVEHITAGPAVPIDKDELFPYMPLMAEQLARRFRAGPPTLVHAHFWMSGYASLLATVDLGIPVVQTFHALGTVKRRHQGDADTSPKERIRIERQLARDSARIIATCGDEVRELIAMQADRERIDVVPCGVDTSLFRPDGPVAARSGRPRLLVVGRLVPRKGVDDAISALSLLPDVELVVAGGSTVGDVDADGDEDIARLRQHAREVGVLGRVRFLGQVPHRKLPELMRSADAVVCMPWYEPFGIVPLEAMACGTPVVGTAVGGLLDTIVDGETGYLVPPRSSEHMARAVITLLKQSQRRRREMGRAGAERVRSHYTWDRVASRTERSYLRACLREHAVPRTSAREAVG